MISQKTISGSVRRDFCGLDIDLLRGWPAFIVVFTGTLAIGSRLLGCLRLVSRSGRVGWLRNEFIAIGSLAVALKLSNNKGG